MENEKNKKLILVINVGSTSTKLAVYDSEELLYKSEMSIRDEELRKFKDIYEQKELRKSQILSFLKEVDLKPSDLSIVATIGGSLPGVKKGAYLINELMIDVLVRFPTFQHASSLGCMVAYEIACSADIPAIIYDSNTTDEMEPVARVLGIKGMERIPTCHALNTRNVARKVAEEQGRSYDECDFLIAHLGGGVSISAHKHGRIVDDIFDDEGPMSPQRAGLVPAYQMIDLCFSGKYTQEELHLLIRGKGGLLQLTGSQNAQEIEEKIQNGDENARMAYYAMAYQIAKGICQLSAVFSGKVDNIILTGGIAHSKMFTDWIIERVSFIAPVLIVPGEFEIEALAAGALRVLNGEEEAKDYDILPKNYQPK